ncbi:MAG: sugar-transfer associated ATP-grasp domain-containing protein, partial [Candidatus Cloacimonadaceae bacterium]|nr:sugar-transfer associated ATP-grasp domain-containing protein [Candidatus Cloacimonadaceae bacterium]
YPLFSFPKHIMVNENGVNYNAKNECIPANEIDEYLGHISVTERELITKPSLDSGGGAGVRKFVWNTHAWVDSANNRLTADLLSRLYNRDFVVQSCVSQHTFLSQFNETSVNTIRVLTYRSVENESIHILHSLLRIGKKGSITDNQASGGISVGISDQGKLNGFAVDKYGNKFYDVNGVKLSSAIQVPQFDAICFEALKLAKELRYSRLLGLDLTINELGEIIVIEINNVSNEINFYQMNNGPLFGSFTDEVLEYCSTNLRSICIDYSL